MESYDKTHSFNFFENRKNRRKSKIDDLKTVQLEVYLTLQSSLMISVTQAFRHIGKISPSLYGDCYLYSAVNCGIFKPKTMARSPRWCYSQCICN